MDRKRYSELLSISNYEDRLAYLMLKSQVGVDTFGFSRYLNQNFYDSREWKNVRNHIIVRDNGCDLGMSDHPISGQILVHHIVPLTPDDIINNEDCLFDEDNLISVSLDTHNLIHYGYEVPHNTITLERRPNDTCPWK